VPRIADIFREVAAAYRDRFGDRMLPSHLRVLSDIVQCRTPALGGHLYRCDDCQQAEYAYHSCRNRHCPTCQGDRSERWAEAQKQRSLPGEYFLLTFTVPESLRPLARSHQREVYDLLLRCAAQSIQKLALDPRYLGAQPGMLGVLHTWTRDLRYHPHVHFLVTAGGLTEDGLGWRKPRKPGFLMPGRVLSLLFRAKIREALESQGLYDSVPKKAWKQKWVIHVQDAGTGDRLLEYLSRYLFRPPVSDQSIVRFEAGRVTLRYRDGRSGQLRHTTLETFEFIRRFLLHVLPRGFTRVRHYGCFSPGSAKKLAVARSLLERHEGTAPMAPMNEASQAPLDLDCVERGVEANDQDETAASTSERPCPFCKTGTMRRVGEIARTPTLRGSPRAPP
jgi:hypothetical protein